MKKISLKRQKVSAAKIRALQRRRNELRKKLRGVAKKKVSKRSFVGKLKKQARTNEAAQWLSDVENLARLQECQETLCMSNLSTCCCERYEMRRVVLRLLLCTRACCNVKGCKKRHNSLLHFVMSAARLNCTFTKQIQP